MIFAASRVKPDMVENIDPIFVDFGVSDGAACAENPCAPNVRVEWQPQELTSEK